MGRIRTFGTRWEQQGFCTWGSIPPADSAGSGSSPARRPVSPRVDDSSAPRSSSVVSASTGIAPRFCVSTSLPGSRRFVRWNECRSSTRLRALVPATFLSGFFSPSLRPVLFHLCSPWIRLRLFPISGSPALRRCTRGLVGWHGCVFLACALRLYFPQLPPPLPSPFLRSVPFPFVQFPFLSSSSLHFGSTASHPAQELGSIVPGSLAVSGSTTPSSGFGSVARGLRRSAPHTTLPERQLRSVRQGCINLSPNKALWTGNRGLWVLISSALRDVESPVS